MKLFVKKHPYVFTQIRSNCFDVIIIQSTDGYSGLLEFSIGMKPTVVTGLIMHPLLAVFLFCFVLFFCLPFP